MSYNRNITLYGTAADKAREASKRAKAANAIDIRRYEASRKEIELVAELLHPEKSYVKSSEHIITNPNAKWNKTKIKSSDSKINGLLKALNELNFYDIIAGTSQSGEELMNKTIAFNSLNNSVTHSNQRGYANESMASWREASNRLDEIKKNGGTIFAWDLETTGGKDLNGVWRPETITEFALQEANAATGEIVKTNVVVGLSKEEGDKIYNEIKNAITMKTIDSDERLKVSASRYAKYGSRDFKMEKVAGAGYYKATSFPVEDLNNYKNLEDIKAGIDNLVKAGQYSRKHAINNVPADIHAVATKLNEMMVAANNKQGIVIGYNDSVFDQQVANSILGKWRKEYGKNLTDLFYNKSGNFMLPSAANLDFLGGAKLTTDYRSINYLHGGSSMAGIDKTRGQEYLLKSHLGSLSKTLRPHMAEDDVTALLGFILNPSEATDLQGKNISLYEHINAALKKVEYTEHNLGIDKHVLRAKRGYGNIFMGKNFMNFAQSEKNKTIYTFDNRMVGVGDAALEASGGVLKENFSLGFGINKGSFYDIKEIRKVTVNDELRDIIGEISPEYYGGEYYHVKLKMVVDEAYKHTRLEDLSQNFLFKSEKELNAFLSGNFDVVAERDGDDIKIVQGMERYFDRRKLKKKKGKARLEKVNTTENVMKDFQLAIKSENERLLASKADNSIFGPNSYAKINKALDLKKNLENLLGQPVTGTDISLIMSEKVANGQIPIKLNNELRASAQDIIKTTLEYNRLNTKRLLDTSVTNMATGITMLSGYEDMLTSVIENLNNVEGFADKSSAAKQEIFNRVVKEVKREAADHLYSKESTSNMMQLGNKRLSGSYEAFKNLFEIDYSSIIKGNRINFVDVANPKNAANILKLDLSNQNNAYTLIDTALDAVYGSTSRYNEPVYKRNAIERMFAMLNKTELGETKAFDVIKDKYGFYKKSFDDRNFHHEEVAEAIVSGMKQLKSRNATKGIINIDSAYMKSLEGHKAYNRALNSQGVLDLIPGIVKDVTDNFVYSEIQNERAAKILAGDLVSKHYMPSLEEVKKIHGDNKVIDILYKNTKKDLTDRIADVLYSATGIEGASISVQDNGALVFGRNGHYESLENLIPKVKMNKETGTLYTELGAMKIQLNNVLNFNHGGNSVKGSARTSISLINDFKLSNIVHNTASTKGANEASDKLISMLKMSTKELRQLPTINGFGGNDIDSNFYVDASNIKKILVDLFAEGGSYNSIINDLQFTDSNLVENIREQLAYYISSGKNLDSLDAETTRNLIKNTQHILNAIIDYNDFASSADFKFLARDLSFSGTEKKTSKLIGVKGNRPHNSAFNIFDNTQRPPVTQSGNAIPLRVEDIKEVGGVKAGNLISVAQIDKRMLKEVNGVGPTTTDVTLNLSYVDNIALRTLIDNNYNKVLNENNVEQKANEATVKAYNYIRNSVSTFEQERIMDSRVHESVYGFKTANTQKLSVNSSLVETLKGLEGKEFDKQAKAMLDHRGVFTMVDGELQFKSSPGTIVKRGESALKWKGFGGIDTDFASKMHNGVFNFRFYNENGLKISDEEINAIIKANRSHFINSKGVPYAQAEMAAILEDLLSKKFNIKGQYSIEDISALGYAKTLSSGVEKGMTDVLYSTTGSYDSKVRQFFKKTGTWEMVKGKVITEEALEAIASDVGSKNVEKALKSANIKDISTLKKLMESERHFYSSILFDDVLNKQAHMLVNDAVAKHNNLGQMYQGTLLKALDLLTKEYKGDEQKAAEVISGLMNEGDTAFITNINLKARSSKERIHSTIKTTAVKGKIVINDSFKTDGDIVSSLDSERFKNLLLKVDSMLTGPERILERNENGEITSYGSHLKVNGEIVGTNTRENIKYVRDVETQTGVNAEYYSLKQEISELKRKKIQLEREKIKGNNTNHNQLVEIKARIREAEDELTAYHGAVKEMRFSDQELSIVERIAITDAHADEIEKLMNEGELTYEALSKTSLAKYISVDENGAYKLSDELRGQRALSKLTKEIKDQQYFDRYTDKLLTEEDLVKYPHLREMYEYAKDHQVPLGKEAALHQHKINMAQKAGFFNEGQLTKKDLLNLNFEERHISDVLYNAEELVEKDLLVDLGKEFGADRYIALPGTGMVVADEEIKTLAQSKLNKLKAIYDQYELHGGNINEDSIRLKDRILEQRNEVIDSVDKIVYGKNGLKHNASRVETGAVSYRLKASGIVSDTATDELLAVAKKMNINVIDESQGLTKKAMINGRTIAEWEKDNVFFDYKFVSRETMDNMGYFSDDTLRKFNFLNADGSNRDEAIKMMEEHLRVHGTFDLTDRYPNTRNGSLNLTKAFLDDTLQNNQTKISVSVVAKANGDNDGDSYSSFRTEFWDSDNAKSDGALYELAKRNGGRNSGYMSPEIYDEFEKMENAMTIIASTDNRHWQAQMREKINKDFKKNIDLSNPDNMVLVPGGSSILGKQALANNSVLPSLKEFNEIDSKINNMLALAYEHAEDNKEIFNTTISKAGNSGELLDKALTVLQGKVSDDVYTEMENLAIKRIGIDRYAQEMMAKTGLAATGAVNLSLNAVKLADHFSNNDPNQIAFTSFVWDALDTAEQGVISSKKLQGGGYNDTTIKDFKKVMGDIFNKGKQGPTKKQVNALGEWLEEHGDGIFTTAYEKMGTRILSENQLSHLNSLSEAERTVEGANMMKNAFLDRISFLSSDELATSYYYSVSSTGRNGKMSKTNFIERRMGAAAADGKSMAAIEQGMSGFADTKQLEIALQKQADWRLSQIENEVAKARVESDPAATNAVKQGIEEFASTISNTITKHSGRGIGRLGSVAAGIGVGLMIGGYASGNPLNDKSAQQHSEEMTQPKETMSIPDFMDKQGGYVTGNSQQGYIINISADTKKGRKHMEKIMTQAAEATVGGAVNVNMNIKNIRSRGITDQDIENYINKFI